MGMFGFSYDDVRTALLLLMRYVTDEFPPGTATASELLALHEWLTNSPPTDAELETLRRIEDGLPWL